MIGAEYIAKYLKSIGVRHIFGYSGSMMLKIADEISLAGGIEFLQNYHEQASSFAANAYARVNRYLGVALVTSGPGAINVLAGIADAYMDSIPLLVITGQDYSYHIAGNPGVRLNGFQDLDIVSIARPITKYSIQVTDTTALAYELEKCVFLAQDSRKGPVLLDVPMDIQFAEMPKDIRHYSGQHNLPVISESDVRQTLSMLKQSKRPLILAGGGIQTADAVKELEEFANKTAVPVVTTLNGFDAYCKTAGFSGLYGNPGANLALKHADLLLVLGARLGQQQVGKKPKAYTPAQVIHVDIDRLELGRVLEESLSICADVKKFLQALNSEFSELEEVDRRPWCQCICEWENQYGGELLVNCDGLDPVLLVKKVSEIAQENTIFTNDVGQNEMWVCQGLSLRKGQRLLSSSGYGSMGFSLPAAIGASICSGGKPVISFAGDGGFQMNLQELQFISAHRLNIKCVVFNNQTLGMMREVQRLYYNNHFLGSNPAEFQCVDLEGLARTYHLEYLQIEDVFHMEQLEKVLAAPDPCLIDCKIQFESYLRNKNELETIFPDAWRTGGSA